MNTSELLTIINEVNKTRTENEIYSILFEAYRSKQITKFCYELLLGNLQFTIRFNEVTKQREILSENESMLYYIKQENENKIEIENRTYQFEEIETDKNGNCKNKCK